MGSPAPSKISQIIDFLEEQLSEALPDHAQLLDPDDLENNPAESLKQGVSWGVDEAENSEREIPANSYWYRRNFTVVIVRSALSLYSDGATKKQAVKDILEDLNLVLLKLKGSRVVIVNGAQVAFDFKFVRDSGPRPIALNDVQHLFIELTVSAEYRET